MARVEGHDEATFQFEAPGHRGKSIFVSKADALVYSVP